MYDTKYDNNNYENNCVYVERMHNFPQQKKTYMMLALCTAVTLRRPFARAYSNANSATRCDACSVINFMLCTTPSTIWTT